jgi:type VI secretion system protein ImpL
MKRMGPYHIWDPSFSWWDGKTNPAYIAYGVQDSQDLSSYLKIQEQNVMNLALTLAKPVVEFLNSQIMLTTNPLSMALLTKWKRIVEQTELFQNKQPGSSIATLENFILTTLKGYNVDTAFEQIKLEDLQQSEGDHFLETIQFIKKGVLGRAEVLTRQKNMKNYTELVDFFNKNLSGRFPFTPIASDSEMGVEADPEKFRAFLEKFKEFGGSFEKILDQIYQLGVSFSDHVKFLKSIEKICEIFSSYLDNKGFGLPFVTFSTEFFTNRDNSIGANFIAQWSIKANYDNVVTNTDKNKQTKWGYGCPTEVSFRWPNVSGIDEPFNDPTQPNLITFEKTANFVYKGNWSLFRMIRSHRANRSEYSPSLNQNSIMLVFLVPVGQNKTAKLFNSISFLAPSANPNVPGQFITFTDFPSFAPLFPPELEALRNESVISHGIVKPYHSSFFVGD